MLKIKQVKNNKIGEQINKLFNILSSINNIDKSEKLLIDLSEATFLYPLQILPLSIIINKLIDNNISVYIRYPKNQTYLNTIGFYKGFDIKYHQDWKNELEYFRKKDFIPIIKIPASQKPNDQYLREQLLTVTDNILFSQLNLDTKFKSPLNYLISEAIDNICDHAQVENAWLMLQNYQNKDFFDLCIIDNGISILGSYKINNFKEIKTDETALQQAIIGKSTKKQAISRGFGISTSREMLVKGLHGEYFLFSGAAFYIQTKDHEQIIKVPQINKWNGTMVTFRIPKTVPENFSFYNYLDF